MVLRTCLHRSKESHEDHKRSPQELGERLYVKITEIVFPMAGSVPPVTLQDCIDYIYNLTFNRTYDGFNREKSVVTE